MNCKLTEQTMQGFLRALYINGYEKTRKRKKWGNFFHIIY